MLVSCIAQDDENVSSALLTLLVLIEIWLVRDRFVSKTTLRSFSFEQQRIGVLLVLEVRLFKKNQKCYNYML